MSLSANPTPLSPQDVEFKLNHGDVKHAPLQLGGQVVRRSKRIFKGVYDFSVQGGAIGSVALYDPMVGGVNPAPPVAGGPSQPLVLPPNFIVSKVFIDVLVAAAGGAGATVALSSQASGGSASDLLAATAFASITGLVDGKPDGTAAHAVKVPSNQSLPGCIPTVDIAVAALTAGKFNVHMEGYLSD